jgi:hypothetical protein
MCSSFTRLQSCGLVSLWSGQRLVHPDEFIDELIEIIFVAGVLIVAIKILVQYLFEIFVEFLSALVL